MPNIDNSHVYATNPNTGHGCLCHPEGKVDGCEGPFIGWPKGFGGDPRMQIPVLCRGCAEKDLAKVVSLPAGEELKANVPFGNLSPEDQDVVRELKPEGGLVRLPGTPVVVDVPAHSAPPATPAPEPEDVLAALDDLVPGDEPGTYVSIADEELGAI